MTKFSTEEVASKVYLEGLDYTIMHYLNPDDIDNPRLAALWKEARSNLAAIEQILFPGGIECWEEEFDKEEDDKR